MKVCARSSIERVFASRTMKASMLETRRINARRPAIWSTWNLKRIFACVQVSMMKAGGIKPLNTEHFKEGHRILASRSMKASMMKTSGTNTRRWPMHLDVDAF